MSPREIMNDQEAEEFISEQKEDRMPEIQSAAPEEEILREELPLRDAGHAGNEYANAFPDWDLLPPQVEIRRVSHRQG